MKKIIILLLYVYEIIKVFGFNILTKINFAIFKVKWRLNNSDNLTTPVKLFPIDLVTVGKHTYGPIDVFTYNSSNERLVIGSYCSVAKDVRFILGGNHITSNFMTFPVNNKFIDETINDSFSKGEICIEDDVWIGVGVIVLSGVIIGQGSVVGAGAVVTKSFPPYSIIGGNPARLLKMRFEDEVVEQLMKQDFKLSNYDSNLIIENISLFNSKLNLEILNKINNICK